VVPEQAEVSSLFQVIISVVELAFVGIVLEILFDFVVLVDHYEKWCCMQSSMGKRLHCLELWGQEVFQQ
jgi:hypothetical protein